MTAWEYLGVEVATGRVLETLPLAAKPRFSRVLNGAGSFTGALNIDGLDVTGRRDVLDATDPGRRAIYALADGQPVWGGWLTPRSRVDLTLSAVEWGGYFAKTVLTEDINEPGDSIEQLTLASALVTSSQAQPGGDVLVALAGDTASGVLRDKTWLAGDAPVIAEQIAALGGLDDGFDWAWPVEWGGDKWLRGLLLLGYPRLGAAEASYVVEQPSPTQKLTGFDEDANDMATAVIAVGAGGVVSTATDPALLAAGYPAMYKVTRYQDVADEAELEKHAIADLKAASGVLTTVRATVPLGDVLSGDVNLGDPVRLELSGRAFPDRWEGEVRCTQIDYDPSSDSAALTLSPRITLGGRVPRPEDDAAQLARLSREIRYLSMSA